MNSWILRSSESDSVFKKSGGGKALNLARMIRSGFPVPPFFCVSAELFELFIAENSIALEFDPSWTPAQIATYVESKIMSGSFSKSASEVLEKELQSSGLSTSFVAVRSSGLDEDAPEHSFAGQFSSFLFQKGTDQILRSIKACWASAYSERAIAYRIEKELPTTSLRTGVVIQKMVNADVSGIAFTRNPLRPLDRDTLVLSSAWGLCEGIVSGELDADHFEVDRVSFKTKSTLSPKAKACRQKSEGGIETLPVASDKIEIPSLTQTQIEEVSRMVLLIEKSMGTPQDCEWAYEGEKLYFVQSRPITSLPPAAFYDPNTNFSGYTLWDNSNIIESYCGVTSPLTFSFASFAYCQVYIQFHEFMGVPSEIIAKSDDMYQNMLGLIRGRIYYNLINWYRLVWLLPGASANSSFMETMMGVKQALKPEITQLFEFTKKPPKYSRAKKLALTGKTLYQFMRIDRTISEFTQKFDEIYQKSRRIDFKQMPLLELARYYRFLQTDVLKRWKAPIINDYLCMIFFGLLKKLSEKWLTGDFDKASLQNDLLCGQGDLESTEPTKTLMRIAKKIDLGDPTFRTWFITQPTDVLKADPRVKEIFFDFLDRYGFRCINELKLEETDLHDDPAFAIQAAVSYVKMKSYSIEDMERRETEIRTRAEGIVRESIRGIKAPIYRWILGQARKAVKNRENLRFLRTKIFGVARNLFRGVGHQFHSLGLIDHPQDVFYLTVEEITRFIEGCTNTGNLRGLIALRKREFEEYRKTSDPPERFVTTGATGVSALYPMVLADGDLLRSDTPVSSDPNLLYGTPCCPGIVEGVVRVAIDAKSAEGLNGEILVTERTDPGWVPLYPSCSGLVIERGSLLSHSAVVARELGLPTIVGVKGGLMKKLKTGMRVRVDAGKGEIRILDTEPPR